MKINEKVLDQLLADCESPEQVLGENGLLKQLTKAVLERALQAEMSHHLGYEKHAPAGRGSGNSRNGATAKKLQGDFGEIELETPRDRNGEFEPRIVAKGQRRLEGFDQKIISLYARGMTTREIGAHLEEIYGVEVSPMLVSKVTEEVIDQVRTWQNRPLERLYPVVFLDALFVKMREGGQVANRAVYVALGVNVEGEKEVLGLWVADSEGAKFWLQVLTELNNRGVEDVLFFCVDGLQGFSEAIEAVYPQATVQLCIVHLVRASLRYVGWKQRKQVAAALKRIYGAATEEAAQQELAAFESAWDAAYPPISRMWRRDWERIRPLFAFPHEVRRILYTTNAVEGLHRALRKATKTRGAFPNEDAALKLLYLVIQNVSKKWKFVTGWRAALNHFEILWPERMARAEGR
jgi:putative transposase